MASYLHERADGVLVEYRRYPIHPVVLHLEARVLRPDGTPHDGGWYPVSDAGLLQLQLDGSDIVELLSA